MTMSYTVYVLEDAEKDVDGIYLYVKRNDSEDKAEKLVQNLEHVIAGLRSSPLRGHYPPELERMNIFDYREVFFKPYRIIYKVSDALVFVHCVLDGRRDLQDLLQQRLFR